MQWTRSQLKERAKFSLKSFYWKSVLVAFILSLVSGGFSTNNRGSDSGESVNITGNEFVDGIGGRVTAQAMAIIGLGLAIIVVAALLGLLISVFVINPLQVGCKKYFLDASEGNADLSNMGFCFKNGYMNVVGVQFLTGVYIFLWSLLLIIPGIIKSYSYRMIPYIMAEDPYMSFSEAKRLSQDMMDGEKWDTFVLDLSFILWALLSVITFNIAGIFWVEPYMQFTDAELYKVLRTKMQGSYTADDYYTDNSYNGYSNTNNYDNYN